MSINPSGGSFQAPIPTWTPQMTGYTSPSGTAYGRRLFDDTTEFYSWYVTSWCLSSSEPSLSESSQKSDATRKILSLIKRIAEVSMNGGYFLSDKDESNAVDGLGNIMQDLSSGGLRSRIYLKPCLKYCSI